MTNTFAFSSRRLSLAGILVVVAAIAGGVFARLPRYVPGTSKVVPTGALEWLATLVILSAIVYLISVLFHYLRGKGYSILAASASVFAAFILLLSVAGLLVFVGVILA